MLATHSLFEKLKEQFHKIDKQGSFGAMQRRAWEQFSQIGLPQKSDEAFRYLPLSDLYSLEFVGVESAMQTAGAHDERMIVLPLSKATSTYSAFLQSRWQMLFSKEKDPLTLLSLALGQEGVFIYVPAGVEIEEPLEISMGKEGIIDPSQIYCFLGKGAKLSLSIRGMEGISLGLCDFALDEGAELSAVIEREGDWHLDSLRASLKRESRFSSISLSRGGKCIRESSIVRLLGEGTYAELKGLDFLSENRKSHHWACMEHCAPGAESNQHFKGVLRDASRMSVEGKIYVEPIAQQTQAYQLINALLLDEGTICNAKPNLEIFADDVKASHGATIAQLNEDERFYLQTRGLSKKRAEELLVHGFCLEILDAIPMKSVRERILSTWLQELLDV